MPSGLTNGRPAGDGVLTPLLCQIAFTHKSRLSHSGLQYNELRIFRNRMIAAYG